MSSSSYDESDDEGEYEWISDSPIGYFESFCGSNSLSLEEIMERMTSEDINLDDFEYSTFLHVVCMNKNVTLEIVDYLLHLVPQAAAVCMDMVERDEGISLAFPIHLACLNEYCPASVILLLLDNSPDEALYHLCFKAETFRYGEAIGGLPLHFYLAREKNVDLDIVKKLLTGPGALLTADNETKCTPMHTLMWNRKNLGAMFDVCKFLVETNPTCLHATDTSNQIPLHIACSNNSF